MGVKLGLIGFVLSESEGGFILITLCWIRVYFHFCFSKIGFVLHINRFLVLGAYCSGFVVRFSFLFACWRFTVHLLVNILAC